METSGAPRSISDTLASLLRMKNTISTLLFLGGTLGGGALGAVVSLAVDRGMGPMALIGGFVGMVTGLLLAMPLMALVEQVFDWMYHLLALQNKMWELAASQASRNEPYSSSV